MSEPWPTGSYDVLADNLVVVFCGLNPSAEAAATGHNFGSASNRFWRALHLAGFTPHRIAAEENRTLLRYGCGITAAVGRATRSAGEVGRAFLGKAAYAAMTGLRDPDWGSQAASFGTARTRRLPNPSCLNRAFKLDRLVESYGALHADVARHLARFASTRAAVVRPSDVPRPSKP